MYFCKTELFEIKLLIFKLHLCKTELFEIGLFLHLTVCKQKTVFKQITELFEKELFLHLTMYSY